MAVIFYALLSINRWSCRLVKINLVFLKRHSFHFEQVPFRSMQTFLSYECAKTTDERTDCFSALYSRLASVPALSCRCMTYAYNLTAMSSLAIVTCLPVVYFGYLQCTSVTCSLLWLPVVYYGYFGYLYAT